MHQNEYKQAYVWSSGSWDRMWFLYKGDNHISIQNFLKRIAFNTFSKIPVLFRFGCLVVILTSPSPLPAISPSPLLVFPTFDKHGSPSKLTSISFSNSLCQFCMTLHTSGNKLAYGLKINWLGSCQKLSETINFPQCIVLVLKPLKEI